MAIRVKEAYANHVVGFNNSSVALGFRNDLHVLFSIARTSNNHELLQMFEEVTEEELENVKEDSFRAKQEAKKQRRARHGNRNIK